LLQNPNPRPIWMTEGDHRWWATLVHESAHFSAPLIGFRPEKGSAPRASFRRHEWRWNGCGPSFCDRLQSVRSDDHSKLCWISFSRVGVPTLAWVWRQLWRVFLAAQATSRLMGSYPSLSLKGSRYYLMKPEDPIARPIDW